MDSRMLGRYLQKSFCRIGKESREKLDDALAEVWEYIEAKNGQTIFHKNMLWKLEFFVTVDLPAEAEIFGFVRYFSPGSVDWKYIIIGASASELARFDCDRPMRSWSDVVLAGEAAEGSGKTVAGSKVILACLVGVESGADVTIPGATDCDEKFRFPELAALRAAHGCSGRDREEASIVLREQGRPLPQAGAGVCRPA